MIIVSLTTTPSRIGHIQSTIDSIRNQSLEVDHIELNIPRRYRRDHQSADIPDHLRSDPFVEIHDLEHDLGPATKVVPALVRYRNQKGVVIISVDDDIIFPRTWFAQLLEGYSGGSFSCGALGMLYRIGSDFHYTPGCKPNLQHHFQVLQGYTAIVYPSGVLGSEFFEYVNDLSQDELAMLSDDLVISYYLYQYQLPIFVNRVMNVFQYNMLRYAPHGFLADAVHKHPASVNNHAQKYLHTLSLCEQWFRNRKLSVRPIRIPMFDS